MEALQTPKAEHIILEAVQLTTNAEIATLRHLTARHSNVLKQDLILRILLTFLPESTDPALYTEFLHDIQTSLSSETGPEISSYEPEISDSSAKRRVRRLHLLPLADPRFVHEDSVDSYTLFLLHQAHKIDAETGCLPYVLRLIEPFISYSEQLRTWAISTFLPLFRLSYEYYPYNGPNYSLEVFETLSGNAAIDSLLFQSAQNSNETKSNLGRDLRGLVGPWMYGANTRKRRKLDLDRPRASSVVQIHDEAGREIDALPETSSGWAHVNEWLLGLSLRNFPLAVEVLIQWDGPRDLDYGPWDKEKLVEEAVVQALTDQYAQAALAAVYSANDGSINTLDGSHQILTRVAKLMDLPHPPKLTDQHPNENEDIPLEFLDTLSRAHLLHNSMLRARNPLTTPTVHSIRLSYLLLESSRILENLGSPMSCKALAELGLFGNEADQRVELRKLLYHLQAKPSDYEKWKSARNQIRWLREWSCRIDTERDTQAGSGVFCRVKQLDLEEEILKALLNSSCYNLAVETYCKNSPLPIPLTKIEEIVVGVALTFYDGASNGNRNRGGVRKSSETITAFHSYFPNSESFSRVIALLSATHAMSFYSLTLQHGVPFQPVNIRAHKDPISLIGKVLDQNTHSYTKLDDLLEIGQNLAAAGLTHSMQAHVSNVLKEETPELRGIYVKRRITAMAIEASLAEGDFDTAYSYVINRLSPPDQPFSVPDSPDISLKMDDDISWRAAYEAGRYCPVLKKGPSALRRLEQRMELLSQALLLAPSSALSDVLIVWQQCEEEMTLLIARETEEEERWDDKGDRRVPGAFSGDSSPIIQKAREPNRAALNEEAPMGLFDVARGAAAALSKNAFPLRSGQNSGVATPIRASHDRGLSLASGGGSESGNQSVMDSEGRIRKRDMVSNMVTGGLASGIGWVIGAPSVRQE